MTVAWHPRYTRMHRRPPGSPSSGSDALPCLSIHASAAVFHVVEPSWSSTIPDLQRVSPEFTDSDALLRLRRRIARRRADLELSIPGGEGTPLNQGNLPS